MEPWLSATVLLSAVRPSSRLTKARRHRTAEAEWRTRTTCAASPVSVTVRRTSRAAVLTRSTCTTVEEPVSATQPLQRLVGCASFSQLFVVKILLVVVRSVILSSKNKLGVLAHNSYLDTFRCDS